MRRHAQRQWAVVMLGVAAAFGATTGCNDLLDVTNPSAITEDNLQGDSQSVAFMMNGVQGEFRREYAWLAAHGAMFTDEAIQGHPWSPWNVYDARNITPEVPSYDGLSYQLLQRARGTADELIPRMEAALGSRAATSLELATAYAYAGYSYIMLADYLCEAPINVSRAFSQDEIYEMAIDRLEQAITIATAAARPGSPAVIDLANVGLARTHLNLGNDAAAIVAAGLVPAGFTAWVRYVPDASDWQVYNFFQWFAGYRFPGELDMAVDAARYTALNADPRTPLDGGLRQLANGLRQGHLPYQASSFSGWTPSTRLMFGEATNIRFASGLEARYIIAEAGGLGNTALRAFIDERRAAGNQGAFGGTDAQLFDELLDQRFRDFFLDGHRMGDLRRYEKQHARDLWPTGTMPGLTQQYGTQKCWPIAASELQSNPNLP